ncbi:hypothetical protein [Oceanobacillus alkalisoli]|uniref:hypothetical protein n=1 Tax=Oceanobacillus alkalisoli TaxID=2925113 RepID=UPI001F119BC0|nr:hypothetical protein [Oceanobacillus alkalisoli]MCF3943966.1 hypothetical protein [Oceanobacillus alkalisoli]
MESAAFNSPASASTPLIGAKLPEITFNNLERMDSFFSSHFHSFFKLLPICMVFAADIVSSNLYYYSEMFNKFLVRRKGMSENSGRNMGVLYMRSRGIVTTFTIVHYPGSRICKTYSTNSISAWA